MANHERGREAEEDEDAAAAAAAQREREEALKRQADALLLAERHEQALRLYRELLAHVTRSQVKLLLQRDLVISCHMNILAALSKLEQWPLVVADATTTLGVIRELQDEAVRQHLEPKDPVLYDHVQARVFYFRGFARFRLGAFGAADADFKEAMKFAPEDESIREDYEELQAAVQAELKVQQLLSAAIKQFQARKYKLAIETCTAALCDSQSLGKDDLTGLIHGNLGAILVKAKDDVRAVEHYKRALLFAQKTVAPAGNPTPAQHERIFDLLDALAGCYSRRKDYSSALSVIDDQIRRFPDCPGRKDRESMMYLNGGRVCCTLGKFDQAERHLRLAKAAALKAGQTEIELNAAYWLSRALSETGNAVDAISVLDGAIPTAEQQQPENVELIGKLLLARLEWLNPTQTGKDEAPKELTPKRIAQLWHTYDYFEKKRYVHGQLCACDALVSALCSVNSSESRSVGTSSSDEVQESEVFRALRVVDTVSIGKLPVEDASILIRLVFLKVDLLLVDPQRRHEAKMLLAKTLRSLQSPGRNEVSRRQKFRAAALHRLVEIVQCEAGEEDPDEEVYDYLEEATDLLRREKDTDPSASVALGELLRRIARFKASRGEFEDAEVLLQESAELPGGQVIPALLPLCVVQLRQGKLREAGKTMKLMETLADANEWKELAVIKDQLNAAAKAKEETRRASKRKGSKGAQKDFDVDTGAVSATASWWERYLWLPLSLCAVLVATLVALWL